MPDRRRFASPGMGGDTEAFDIVTGTLRHRYRNFYTVGQQNATGTSTIVAIYRGVYSENCE
jgi:hypothetical protein